MRTNLLVTYTSIVGSGATRVETRLSKKRGIGVDINPSVLDLARINTDF